METNIIYNQECLQGMKERIPDNSIDMILADLPYGTTACKWDSIIPLELLWEQYKRIVKKDTAIILTASGKFAPRLKMSNFDQYKYEWIWEKNFGSNFVNASKQPLRYHEHILVFYRKQPTYNPQYENYADSVYEKWEDGDSVNVENAKKSNKIQDLETRSASYGFERGKHPRSVKFFKAVHRANNERKHPSQKPLSLFKYLIKTYTNKKDIVLDNVIGSGTTAVAAKALGRKYIGFEQDEEYYKIAQERVSKVQKELI